MILPDIPEELVEEILCRVPATSLKRLRSTCKQWDRLFNDTKFSRKHFDKAAKQYPVVVMTKEDTLSSLSVNLHDGIPYAEVTGELSLNQVGIDSVFHCDGLLLCTIIGNSRSILVWNPCTGQTKWIQTGESRCYQKGHKFVLGNYQDNNSCNKSYKILSYHMGNYNRSGKEFNIYDISSSSWRNLDVVTPFLDYMYSTTSVSLKGKTYWFVRYGDSSSFTEGLMSFNYRTERFERLRLPYKCNTYKKHSLSVVGEEKLSVLLQHACSSRCEVWITSKIDYETKDMSWSKLLEVEFISTGRVVWFGGRFLVDEEKKIVLYFERGYIAKPESVITVCIAGADSNGTRGSFPVTTMTVILSCFVNFVPSLIQIV